MDNKKYTQKIDYKALKVMRDTSLNLSAHKGFRRIQNITKFISVMIIGGFVVFCMNVYIKRYINYLLKDKRKLFIDYIEKPENENLDKKMLKIHSKDMITFNDMKKYYQKEAAQGILKFRYELLSKAEGIVLETCCGAFPNALCYPSGLESKISSIVGIDWNKELLEFASIANKKDNTKLIMMDARDLDFVDEAFDTVVDTFGLQACRNPQLQYKEMKRVCKKGGKILMLEYGESFWLTTNLRNIRDMEHYFEDNGMIVTRNWNDMILNDPEVSIVQHKRRNYGFLYYYELVKN